MEVGAGFPVYHRPCSLRYSLLRGATQRHSRDCSVFRLATARSSVLMVIPGQMNTHGAARSQAAAVFPRTQHTIASIGRMTDTIAVIQPHRCGRSCIRRNTGSHSPPEFITMHTPAYRFEDLTLFSWHVLSLDSHISTRTDPTATALVFSQPLRPLPSVAFETKRPEIIQHGFATFGNRRDVIHFEPSALIRGFPA